MEIANLNIKPLCIYLPDEDIWIEEYEQAKKYFPSIGIDDVEWVAGIHAKKFGVQGTHIYLLDGRPEEQFHIGQAKVGGFLSHYMLYCIMNTMKETHFLVLECDAKFVDGWKGKLAQALSDVPPDFDMLFVGSCCAADKEPVHIKGDVYHYPYRGEDKWQFYPQCGHAYIVAKKAIPTFIATQRDTASPVDVSLIKYAFPSLNIYAILPRISDQGKKTCLPA